MSIVVQQAHFDPDCEGCRAAQKALETESLLRADCLKKIKQQAEKIQELETKRQCFAQ